MAIIITRTVTYFDIDRVSHAIPEGTLLTLDTDDYSVVYGDYCIRLEPEEFRFLES